MSINDKQHVLDLFNQAEPPSNLSIDRRTFCTMTGLSLIGLSLPGCSESHTALKAVTQETEFTQLFDILFPASELGLSQYREKVLSRIQRLSDEKAEVVIQLYKRFKGHLWLKRDLGMKEYSKSIGEACLTDLIESKYADQCNLAMDTIYYELSKEKKLMTAIWGRKFSVTDKKCVYWDTYDKAIV